MLRPVLLPIPDEAPVTMIVLPSRRFPIAVAMARFIVCAEGKLLVIQLPGGYTWCLERLLKNERLRRMPMTFMRYTHNLR